MTSLLLPNFKLKYAARMFRNIASLSEESEPVIIRQPNHKTSTVIDKTDERKKV